MRLLVTGGSGFVGSAFIDSLGDEHDTVCIGRKRFFDDTPNVTFIEADIVDKQSLKNVANQLSGNDIFDAVVHMAAYVPRQQAADELQASHDVNIQGTINVLEAFKGCFSKFIIGSTAEVYDQSLLMGDITEASIVGPTSYYGATKLGSEFIVGAFGKKENIPVTVLRFSVMYGPNDPIARALPNFIKKALTNETIEITGGQVVRDYVYVDDVVESIHCALRSDYSGVLNIGTGTAISIEEAARTIVRESESTANIIVNAGGGGVDIVINPTAAEAAIGFRAKTLFSDGIKGMIESYR